MFSVGVTTGTGITGSGIAVSGISTSGSLYSVTDPAFELALFTLISVEVVVLFDVFVFELLFESWLLLLVLLFELLSGSLDPVVESFPVFTAVSYWIFMRFNIFIFTRT
ncbi:hypothetical protein [Mycoplasma bradburyae]|uniref:hypothetical protein n=1 Tax=Mycoplasma bradburyae TaxID=2963128 RepID=UPI0023423825|nr:hypothetical protein [Mycoplasma bradburyae]